MSIDATLWALTFPEDGEEYIGCEWIEVIRYNLFNLLRKRGRDKKEKAACDPKQTLGTARIGA